MPTPRVEGAADQGPRVEGGAGSLFRLRHSLRRCLLTPPAPSLQFPRIEGGSNLVPDPRAPRCHRIALHVYTPCATLSLAR